MERETVEREREIDKEIGREKDLERGREREGEERVGE